MQIPMMILYMVKDHCSGYWDKKGEIRDAEKGENKNDDPVVDVPSVAFAPESGTKYINTTLYDYETELGTKRQQP